MSRFSWMWQGASIWTLMDDNTWCLCKERCKSFCRCKFLSGIVNVIRAGEVSIPIVFPTCTNIDIKVATFTILRAGHIEHWSPLKLLVQQWAWTTITFVHFSSFSFWPYGSAEEYRFRKYGTNWLSGTYWWLVMGEMWCDLPPNTLQIPQTPGKSIGTAVNPPFEWHLDDV